MTLVHHEDGDVSLEGHVVPKKILFDTWDRCYIEMEILMKMLAIGIKRDG